MFVIMVIHEKHTNPTTDVICAYHIPGAGYLSDSIVAFCSWGLLVDWILLLWLFIWLPNLLTLNVH